MDFGTINMLFENLTPRDRQMLSENNNENINNDDNKCWNRNKHFTIIAEHWLWAKEGRLL